MERKTKKSICNSNYFISVKENHIYILKCRQAYPYTFLPISTVSAEPTHHSLNVTAPSMLKSTVTVSLQYELFLTANDLGLREQQERLGRQFSMSPSVKLQNKKSWLSCWREEPCEKVWEVEI
jgi:hypothetical protein